MYEMYCFMMINGVLICEWKALKNHINFQRPQQIFTMNPMNQETELSHYVRDISN